MCIKKKMINLPEVCINDARKITPFDMLMKFLEIVTMKLEIFKQGIANYHLLQLFCKVNNSL